MRAENIIISNRILVMHKQKLHPHTPYIQTLGKKEDLSQSLLNKIRAIQLKASNPLFVDSSKEKKKFNPKTNNTPKS